MLLKISEKGSLRSITTHDGSIKISIIDFIDKSSVYKTGTGRAKWAEIKEVATNPTETFHKECVSIVAGLYSKQNSTFQ